MDRDKVINYLESEIKRAEQSVNDTWLECVEVKLLRYVLSLLKEKEAVVRCKDCKHYMTIHCTCDGCCISDDWYCADGERR